MRRVQKQYGRHGRRKLRNCRLTGPMTKIGNGFYKMDKQNITTIREDLANDFYPLAMTHSDEIRKMLEEFEDDQLLLAMELEDKEGGCNG